MPQNERSTLRVEGKDDKFAIRSLLARHGIDLTDVDFKFPWETLSMSRQGWACG